MIVITKVTFPAFISAKSVIMLLQFRFPHNLCCIFNLKKLFSAEAEANITVSKILRANIYRWKRTTDFTYHVQILWGGVRYIIVITEIITNYFHLTIEITIT